MVKKNGNSNDHLVSFPELSNIFSVRIWSHNEIPLRLLKQHQSEITFQVMLNHFQLYSQQELA